MKFPKIKITLFHKAMSIIIMVIIMFTSTIFFFFVPKVENQLRDLEWRLAKNELSKIELIVKNRAEQSKKIYKTTTNMDVKIWNNLDSLMLHKKESLLKKLQMIIEKIRLNNNSCLSIFDKNGEILIHSDKLKIAQNIKNVKNPSTENFLYDDLIKAFNENKKLDYFWEKSNDKGNFIHKKISWVEYNDYFGWYIVSSVYYDDVNRSSKELKNYILIATFVIFIFAIFSGFFYIRKILFPLQELSSKMQKVKDGNYDIRFDYYGSDEFGDLSTGFNEMLEKIQNNIKNLDEKVKKRTARVQKQFMELNKTQIQLIQSEKLASLGGLVAGVAHEINTPVGMALTGTTHLTEEIEKLTSLYNDEEMSEDEFEEFLTYSAELSTSIETNLQRAAALVRGFKQVAVDQSSEEDREFLLKEYIVDEILTSLHNKIKKTKHKVVVNIDEKITLKSNPGAFSQILTNFIINTLIHAYDKDDEGLIKIEARLKENRLILTYRDDGKGMDKETKRQVFDPFFTTNRGGGGSGLGMHITYNLIVNKLNGTIRCESRLGAGVAFIMEIPTEKVVS